VYGTLDNENHYKNLLTLRDFLYKLIEHWVTELLSYWMNN
jgi:hypothetical protein